jgi:hypothetical protein
MNKLEESQKEIKEILYLFQIKFQCDKISPIIMFLLAIEATLNFEN